MEGQQNGSYFFKELIPISGKEQNALVVLISLWTACG